VLTAALVAGAVLLGAAPRDPGASRLLRTPSFDILVQRTERIVDRGQPLHLDVTVAPHADADDVSLAIDALERSPLAQTQRSVPVRARADDLHHYTAVGVFPERGFWILRLTIGLQNGHSESAELPIRVTDPNALPPAAAWLIGMSPLVALFAFALSEAARAQRLAGRRDRFAQV
jgi:hypothetical protein